MKLCRFELSVDRWDEPDVVAGEKRCHHAWNVTITSLVPGKAYSLLKYDDYHKVPDADFLAKGGYAWKHEFNATGTTQTFADTFHVQRMRYLQVRCGLAGFNRIGRHAGSPQGQTQRC